MTRRVLTDAQWAIIEPYCLGKTTDPGQTGRDPRLFLEAVLWIVRRQRINEEDQSVQSAFTNQGANLLISTQWPAF